MRVTQYNALAQCYVRSASSRTAPPPRSSASAPPRPPPVPTTIAPSRSSTLARALLTRVLRPAPPHPSPPRRWKARSKALADELASIDADVLALQESTSTTTSGGRSSRRGYAGWFCKRTERTAPKKDGCGLFYKRDAFELIARRDVQFNDLAVSHLGPGERARRARGRRRRRLRATGARAGNDGTRRPSNPPKTRPLRNDDATLGFGFGVGSSARRRAVRARLRRDDGAPGRERERDGRRRETRGDPSWSRPRTSSGTRARGRQVCRRSVFWRRRRISYAPRRRRRVGDSLLGRVTMRVRSRVRALLARVSSRTRRRSYWREISTAFPGATSTRERSEGFFFLARRPKTPRGTRGRRRGIDR